MRALALMLVLKEIERARARRFQTKMELVKQGLSMVRTAKDYLLLTELTFDEPGQPYVKAMEELIKETRARFMSLKPSTEEIALVDGGPRTYRRISPSDAGSLAAAESPKECGGFWARIFGGRK